MLKDRRIGYFLVPEDIVDNTPELIPPVLDRLKFVPLRVERTQMENGKHSYVYLGISPSFRLLSDEEVAKDEDMEIPSYTLFSRKDQDDERTDIPRGEDQPVHSDGGQGAGKGSEVRHA